jgi:hypothetical protein
MAVVNNNGQNAENRMLVFYSPDNLGRLVNAQTFFMDGTFSVAPHPFNSCTPSGFFVYSSGNLTSA